MSLLEPRLGDLRAGFGGLGFSSGLSLPSSQIMPLWRPQLPPATWCSIPSCPCAISRPLMSRSYLMSDLYDYPPYPYPWSAWYLKAAQDSGLYKGLPLAPPSLEPRPNHHDDIADHRSSPGKELPTKSLKQDRHKERLELLKPLKFDKDHAIQHRQAVNNVANRMHLSSVSPSPPPSSNVDQYHNIDHNSVSEAYRLHHHQLISNHPALRSPPAHPPPQYQPPRDLPSPNEAPLNLSITNGSSVSSESGSHGNHGGHSPSQSRPSVITCAASASSVNGRYESSGSLSSSPSRREIQSDICDPAIEEHFRRSLGKNYPDFMGKHTSATPSPPLATPHGNALTTPHPITMASQPNRQVSPSRTSPPTGPKVKAIINSNVSITGSVDDHFARALGDSTWSALKAKNEQEAPMPGSVDDHFAKALGDTWLRIKAERESPRGPPPPFPMPLSIPHSISHAHALPPHHPPRVSSPTASSHTTSLVST